MAAPIRPAATKAFGAEKWVFVPTIADPTAPKLSTELNAAGALDVTKMFFASSARPDASANMAKAERRLGDVESFEFVGETSYTLGEVRYSFNPQGAALSTGVQAFEKLPQGTTGYLVRRLGINRDTDLAVGQFVTSSRWRPARRWRPPRATASRPRSRSSSRSRSPARRPSRRRSSPDQTQRRTGSTAVRRWLPPLSLSKLSRGNSMDVQQFERMILEASTAR
jgi:hypothetical protein